MKLKPGDKVRFLNDVMEGNVTKLLSRDRVEVTDEHGFLHVADEKQLVRIDYQPEPAHLNLVPASEDVEKIITARPDAIQPVIHSMKPDETIYAGVRLKDEQNPFSSDIELLIINNTVFTVMFTVSSQMQELRKGIDGGMLQPRTEMMIGVFSQDEMNESDGFEFQMIFFRKHEYTAKPPAVKNLRFNSSDLMNMQDESRVRLNNSSVYLWPLHFFRRQPDVDVSGLIKKFEETGQKPGTTKKKSSKDKFTVLSRQKVVDLHIEQLVKDYAGMNNAQIISYQLNYFMYEMDQALLNRLHKIIFIHGVGQGVLKSAIREELKKFPDIRVNEAPPELYGYGATEVELL